MQEFLMSPTLTRTRFEEYVRIDLDRGWIEGSLAVPNNAQGAVIFAHGSGSSRHSPRNRYVAEVLHNAGLVTLLIDLLTADEERADIATAEHRFDIQFLADRLGIVTNWLAVNYQRHNFHFGYFGASTGAAAALVAASARNDIGAIVSRGGRPDLAGDSLTKVRAATLLIVGSRDSPVLDMNQVALDQLKRASEKEIAVIPGATHLFEEVGALERVAHLASQWFVHHLQGVPTTMHSSLT
jgi:putative phosphoribosyl transferase